MKSDGGLPQILFHHVFRLAIVTVRFGPQYAYFYRSPRATYLRESQNLFDKKQKNKKKKKINDDRMKIRI
jgi:hypothetical protein